MRRNSMFYGYQDDYIQFVAKHCDMGKLDAIGFVHLLADLPETSVETPETSVESPATMEESERIAREMNDGLAQVLTYVNAKSQAARQFLSSGQETNAKKQLIELEGIAKDMYADVREAILDLRTTTSKHRDMVSTLQEYVLRFSEMSGTKTELTISNGNIPTLSPNAEVQVIRIIQEALTNVRKHARANHAQVRISTEDRKCNIVIEDNGLGFDVSDIRRDVWPQFGLQTMKERAESIKGTLNISSSIGNGTKVILSLPMAQRKA